MSVFITNKYQAMTDYPLSRQELNDIVKEIVEESTSYVNCPYECTVEVTFTDDEEIHQLNLKTRKIDSATDVLSFPMLTFEDEPGDLSFLDSVEYVDSEDEEIEYEDDDEEEDEESDEDSEDDEEDEEEEEDDEEEEEEEEFVQKHVDYFDPDSGELLLGDIVISLDHARAQAEEYGHSLKREIAFLTAHSMLHLFGYDHVNEDDRIQMEKMQEEILSQKGYTRDAAEPND